MADDVQVSAPVPGGNGERLELKFGGRSLGLTSKDIVSVLVVLLLGGLIYFMSQNVTEGQRQGFAGLAQILDRMGQNQQQTLDKLATNQQALLELVHENRAQLMVEISKQNEMVHTQTLALQRSVEEQTKELRRMLVSINWNISHGPEERIPVEFLPSEMPQHKGAR